LNPFGIEAVAAGLQAARREWRAANGRLPQASARELPAREVLAQVVNQLRGALFPKRLGPAGLRPEGENAFVELSLLEALHELEAQVLLELRLQAQRSGLSPESREPHAHHLVQGFSEQLPAIRRLLDSDVLAAYEGDPAAGSVDEVLLCYPGLRALINHRLAHALHRAGAPLVARVVAELAHAETGIDIHPGAQIGAGFFIDHGTGVVIGQTAEIGRRVRLYQNVTLGAKRFQQDEVGNLLKGLPRHPVLEDGVVIYAGATVLGRITIGARSVIGGNVWLTHSVGPDSVITQGDLRSQVPAANSASPASLSTPTHTPNH
jgi:serine O-acetyltransferase